MDILERTERLVEDFRGDVEELAAVMRRSWAEGSAPPYLYTTESMASWLAQPGLTPALTPAIYDHGRLVAFALGCPRTVILNHRPRRLLISAFLTAAAEVKRRGHGLLAWGALHLRARAAGFDGVVSYCEEGGALLGMIDGASRLFGLRLTHLKRFDHLVRPITPTPGHEPLADTPDPVAAERLVELAARVPSSADLARTWTLPEARWQLSRPNAVAVAHPGGALIDATVATVADVARTRCLVIDDVLWGTLPPDERFALAAQLLSRAASAGAAFASVPALGYADLEPLHRAGFVPAGHVSHAYLATWGDPQLDETPCERFYLDVV